MAVLGGSSWVYWRTAIPCISLLATLATKKHKEVPGTMPEETAATNAAPAAKRLPVKTLRVEDCSGSIWAREQMVRGEMRTFFSVTFERSYKDRDGAWKYTRSFDPDSLGKLVTLCQQASEAITSFRQRADE
jgi:hypothetical protein